MNARLHIARNQISNRRVSADFRHPSETISSGNPANVRLPVLKLSSSCDFFIANEVQNKAKLSFLSPQDLHLTNCLLDGEKSTDGQERQLRLLSEKAVVGVEAAFAFLEHPEAFPDSWKSLHPGGFMKRIFFDADRLRRVGQGDQFALYLSWSPDGELDKGYYPDYFARQPWDLSVVLK